jgi:hypothetical protein
MPQITRVNRIVLGLHGLYELCTATVSSSCDSQQAQHYYSITTVLQFLNIGKVPASLLHGAGRLIQLKISQILDEHMQHIENNQNGEGCQRTATLRGRSWLPQTCQGRCDLAPTRRNPNKHAALGTRPQALNGCA